MSVVKIKECNKSTVLYAMVVGRKLTRTLSKNSTALDPWNYHFVVEFHSKIKWK